MFTFLNSHNVHYFITEDCAYKLVAGLQVEAHAYSCMFKHVENHFPAWQKALYNLTAISHLNGQVTQFPKILKSKQVLKRSQVKSGIDSIGLQMQSLLSV